MKYLPKLKMYTASNLIFDAITFDSYSYAWFAITKELQYEGKGTIFFNTYAYSPTTRKHISKIRKILDQYRDTNRIIEIEAPKGLQNLLGSQTVLESLLKELNEQLAKTRPGTKKEAKLRNRHDELHRSLLIIMDLRT